MSVTRVWHDNRSGHQGQLAGNIVLGLVRKGEPIVHEKGTVFSTPTRIIIGRICASSNYLQPNIAHFCNLSKDQFAAVSELDRRKKIFFVFVTNHGKSLHYWNIPGLIVKRALSKQKPKPGSESTCFLRIYQEDGKYYLGDAKINVTRFHHVHTLRGKQAAKLSNNNGTRHPDELTLV